MAKKKWTLAERVKMALMGGPGLTGYAFQGDLISVAHARRIIPQILKADPSLTPDELEWRSTDHLPQPDFFGETVNPKAKKPATKKAAKKPAAKKATPKKPAAKKAAPKKPAAKKAAKKPEAASKPPQVSFTVQVKQNPTVIRKGEALAKRAMGGTSRVHKLDMMNLSDGRRSRVKIVALVYSRGGTRYVHRPKDGGAQAYLYGAQPGGTEPEKSPRLERMPVGAVEWGRLEALTLAAGGQETNLAFPAGSRPLVLVAPNAEAYWIAHTKESWDGAPQGLRVMLVRRSTSKVASARGLID